MAARKEWITKFKNFTNLAASSLLIGDAIGDGDLPAGGSPAGWTIRRTIATLALRSTTVSNTTGWFFMAHFVAHLNIDSADLSAAMFTGGTPMPFMHVEAVPFMGLAGDSTGVGDLRPLTIVRWDSAQMRRIERGEVAHIGLYNQSTLTVEYSYILRMLVSESP